jgi:hypothetical protein
MPIAPHERARSLAALAGPARRVSFAHAIGPRAEAVRAAAVFRADA